MLTGDIARALSARIEGDGAIDIRRLVHPARAERPSDLALAMSSDAAGWSADALEAQAFAFLAVRSLRGLPLTFPATTGVATPMRGGLLAQP